METELESRYRTIRRGTVALASPLGPEDAMLQSMPEASPTKWHLAHTTWFFEAFVLARALPTRPAYREAFQVLFNSYYEAMGRRIARHERGLMSRPTLAEVHDYRAAVDAAMLRLLEGGVDEALAAVIELGLHHEQQHQELLLTDALHALSRNPLRPAYATRGARAATEARARDASPLRWLAWGEALRPLGLDEGGFGFDNERPKHRVVVPSFALGARLVTCGEFADFIEDHGYERPELWLSDGWAERHARGWEAPLYWERESPDAPWRTFTLSGMRDVDPSAPVCHVSFYEAYAYAQWAGARLPTEMEWETAAAHSPVEGNFLESGELAPRAVVAHVAEGRPTDGPPAQLFGDVWEWTGSAYAPYPGYRPLPDALGEYNGKFMCNQMVLRGGSCFSPESHLRATYRNFFGPAARWQMTGIRLGRDAG